MAPKRVQGTRLAHTKEEEALGIPGVGCCSKKVYRIQLYFRESWGGSYGEISGSPQGLLGVSVAVPLRCQSEKQEGRRWLLQPE